MCPREPCTFYCIVVCGAVHHHTLHTVCRHTHRPLVPTAPPTRQRHGPTTGLVVRHVLGTHRALIAVSAHWMGSPVSRDCIRDRGWASTCMDRRAGTNNCQLSTGVAIGGSPLRRSGWRWCRQRSRSPRAAPPSPSAGRPPCTRSTRPRRRPPLQAGQAGAATGRSARSAGGAQPLSVCRRRLGTTPGGLGGNAAAGPVAVCMHAVLRWLHGAARRGRCEGRVAATVLFFGRISSNVTPF
jgi:hypothetical protein